MVRPPSSEPEEDLHLSDGDDYQSNCHQSDAETGEARISLEQSYRETMSAVRAYMNWLEVPEFVETPQ